jgi:hypothetical protein
MFSNLGIQGFGLLIILVILIYLVIRRWEKKKNEKFEKRDN